MESELLKDVMFFNEIINDSKMKGMSENENKKKKTPQNLTSEKTGCRKARASKSPQKENLIPEKGEVKKMKRVSNEKERKPLKVLGNEIKSKKKDGVSPTKEKAGVPVRRTRSLKPVSSPKGEKQKKEKQAVPKIIIYRDTPSKGKEIQNKRGRRKSWDGSDTTARRFLEEKKKSLKLAVPVKTRHSFNDITSIRSPSKRGKTKIEEKKSPGREKPRTPKLKPGNPEFEERLAKLELLFPNVDPDFLRTQFLRFKGSLSETIELIIIKEKTNDLPTRSDYVRRAETERLQNKFWENFSVENFLRMIPDPWEHFLKKERANSAKYLGHSLHYLKNKYKKHYIQAIRSALAQSGNSLYLADKNLKKKNRLVKMRATNRSKFECDAGKPTTFDIQFMHEVAFIENETKIKSQIKKRDASRYKKFKKAEETGALLKCQSCDESSFLPDDTVDCPANHVFCKDCVVKYVEIEMGKDNFQFKCLIECEEKFSMESLQEALSPFVMAQIIRRNQLEELKSAGIEDLAFCPFCYFVLAMPPEMGVFKCLNPSCMIESCRYCKQLNHIPLKCDELEKFNKTLLDAEIQVENDRERAEEKKEEKNSCLRCQHCNGEFLEREDPEQLVCPCGGIMCSICRQPFPECPHLSNHHPPQQLSCSSDDTDYDEMDEDPEANQERSPWESDSF